MYEYYNNEDRQVIPDFGEQFGNQFMPPFNIPQFNMIPPNIPSIFPGSPTSMPSGAPPSFMPNKTTKPGIFAVDPGAIRPCLHRFVYIWLRTGEQFWAWLVFVGRRSAAGWRWTGFRWIYFGVDLRNIESFTCF